LEYGWRIFGTPKEVMAMTLRWFHLVFLLFVMVGADMFGAWAIYHHGRGDAPLLLALGILALIGGLGLAVYVFWLVRKLDLARIQ
jgi:hypothetical protein